MASELEQLDPESALLLYIADELTAEHRDEVERRLATDAAFSAALQRLRESDFAMQAMFRSADAATPLPVARDVAVRRVGRAMQQWQIDRMRRPVLAPAKERNFRLPWWGYVAGGAAAVVATILIWSNNINDSRDQRPTMADAQEQEELSNLIAGTFNEPIDQPEDVSGLSGAGVGDEVAIRSESDDVMNSIFLRRGTAR